jgi:hypothetical protein
MRAQATIGVLLTGCAYQAGSFDSMLRPFTGERATFGCLDLAVERRPDLPGGAAVLAYSFGNRCDHPTLVDLASVAVVAHTPDGDQHQLSPYDPHHEIASMLIDGRAVGNEAIAYRGEVEANAICLDAGAVAHSRSARWMCFPASRSQVTEVP